MIATVDSISTYKPDELISYFEREFKKPWWRPWLGNVDRALDDAKDELDALTTYAIGVKLNPLVKAGRHLSEDGRYRYAVWRWLWPRPPVPGAAQLISLRRLAGLEHVNMAEFAARIIEECVEIGRKHPALERWVCRRIALAEYPTRPARREAGELRSGIGALQIALIGAIYKPPAERISIARRIKRAAMHGGALALRELLGAHDPTLSANLMVPLHHGTEFTPSDVARRNADRAVGLWGIVPAHVRRLAIVAETEEAAHVGFWVPVLKGDKGAVLPGAPTAFMHGHGSAVFKDDLPPLEGFQQGLEARWREFMINDFREDLFVSIPFRVSTGAHEITAAVFNVNVSSGDLRPWRRAYHREWLALARDAVGPMVQIAYSALLIILAEGGANGRLLDTGAAEWDTLPVDVPRRLAGGTHEPRKADDREGE